MNAEKENTAANHPAAESDSRDSSQMADDIEGMSWYVAKAAVGFEKAARAFLEERIGQEEMGAHFGEIMMPVEQVLSIGTKKTTEKKLFPGYLFIQIRTYDDGRMDDRCWHLVRRTRKISGFVSGTSGEPQRLTPRDVAKIRNKMAELSAKEPSLQARFATGDTVRVKEGAFMDFTGTVESVNADRNRLKVLVMVLGRATPVELDFNQVDKA